MKYHLVNSDNIIENIIELDNQGALPEIPDAPAEDANLDVMAQYDADLAAAMRHRYAPPNGLRLIERTNDWLQIGDNINASDPGPHSPSITEQINALVKTITNDRIADAILGADNGWLANTKAQINALKAQL